MSIPEKIKIYHITHYENLRSMCEHGAILSDAECLNTSMQHKRVGMSSIKKRRLEEIKVPCHEGTTVGQYVPFNFCPRSVMLFILHKGNHPDIVYRNGQQPIIHIEVDLIKAINWADSNNVLWAFTDCNASSSYAEFYNKMDELSHLNWDAIKSSDFRSPYIKDAKQAEFLLFKSLPIDLIEKIGVINNDIKKVVEEILCSCNVGLVVEQKCDWYY